MEKRPATAAAAPGPEVPCDPAEAAAQKDHTAMYMAFIHETRKYNLDCEKRFGDMTRAYPTLHFTHPKPPPPSPCTPRLPNPLRS